MYSKRAVRALLSVLASTAIVAAQSAEAGSRAGGNTIGGGPAGLAGPGGGSGAPVFGGYGSRDIGPNSASEHGMMLGSISRYARDLGKKWGEQNPDILPLIQQIQSDAKFLQIKWSDWNRSYGSAAPRVPMELDPYFRQLRSDASALESAKKLPAPKTLEVVRIVARDLRTKALNCENSADGLGKQILVSARTLKGGAEAPGFEIFYVPMALLGQKAEHKRFPTLSSPATHNNIPPGYYAIWLRKNSATNIHTAQDILSDKQGKCALEIIVPDEFHASR
jgi:hypothetical protein